MDKLPCELLAMIAIELWESDQVLNLIEALRCPFRKSAHYIIETWRRRRRPCTFRGYSVSEQPIEHTEAYADIAIMYLRHDQLGNFCDTIRAFFDKIPSSTDPSNMFRFSPVPAYAHTIEKFDFAIDFIVGQIQRSVIENELTRYRRYKHFIETAALLGKEDFVRYALQKEPSSGKQICESLMQNATVSGNISLINFVLELRTDPENWYFNSCAWEGAAQNGSIEIAELLLAKGIPLISSFFRSCCRHRQMRLLEWGLAHNLLEQMRRVDANEASRCGSLNLMRLLGENCFQFDSETLRLAVIYNSVPVVEYLLDTDCPCEIDLYEVAARQGRIDMLQFLASRGMRPRASTFRGTLSMRYKEGGIWILRRFRYDGDEKDICRFIAHSGDVDLLRCARLWCAYPWDKEVCNIAAEHGNIELLEWAVDRACPWSPDDALQKATENDQKEVMRWIRGRM